MFLQIESIDNVVELTENVTNIEASEEATEIIEIDQDTFHIVIREEEADLPQLQLIETSIIIEENQDTTTIIEVGCDVISGGSDPQTLKVPFAFDDPSPKILTNVDIGQCIKDAFLHIDTPFDDLNAELSIGTALDDELILTKEENCPQLEGSWQNQDSFSFGSLQSIRLFINAGASTQGSGYVLLTKI
jgi:hypothetical protein